MAATHRIGHIRLDEVLGEGAMGTVWAGVDEKLRRDVAVKTLRSDRVTAETRARLLIEARILSRLEVAGICRVYDYMEDDDNGYLVLERVHGRTLREVIADRPDTEVVLDLAEQLAAALAAAHARGVIHRDLKPSNVMLTAREEGAGEQVKVLDFGLARAALEVASERPESSAAPSPRRAEIDGSLTRFGSLIDREDGRNVTGTPAYMSPEQARGEDASAASDMYSYGLVLQELLTGRCAYEEDLSLDRLMVRAAAGNTLPAEGVDGELRKLVEDLKAFDPHERPSAAAAGYRLRRIRDRPRRLRRRVAVALLISAALFGAVKYSLDLRHERNLAVAAGEEAREVADFLASLFEAANPFQQGAPTVRGFLDHAAARIDELEDRPIVQSRILHTVGIAYRRLEHMEDAGSLLEGALELRRRALGDRHPDTASTLSEVALIHLLQGDSDAAEAKFREALEIQKEVLGRHPDTAETLRILANIVGLRDLEARIDMLHEALAIYRELPEGDPIAKARALDSISHAMRVQGNLADAEKLAREAIGLYESRSDRRAVLERNDLGKILNLQGRLEAAEEAHRVARESIKEVWGDRSVSMAVTLARLGDVKREQGDLEAADALYEQALAIAAENVPESIPADGDLFAYFYTKVSRLLELRGDLQAAIARSKQAIEILESTIGGPILSEELVHLADLRRQGGDLEGAESSIETAFQRIRDQNATSHWIAREAESVRGALLSAQGRREEAEALLVRGFEGLREMCGDRSTWTERARARLLEHYEAGASAHTRTRS